MNMKGRYEVVENAYKVFYKFLIMGATNYNQPDSKKIWDDFEVKTDNNNFGIFVNRCEKKITLYSKLREQHKKTFIENEK